MSVATCQKETHVSCALPLASVLVSCTYGSRMYCQSVDVVVLRFNDLLDEPKLGSENHTQLASTVQVCRIHVLLVDFCERTKVDVRWCHAMNFR